MKSNITYKCSFLTTLLIVLVFSFNGIAQENVVKNYRMLYKFNTVKQADNTRLFEVSFIARNKKDRKDKVPVYGAEIIFFNILGDNELELGSAKTTKEGIATIIVPTNQKYLKDNEGNITFLARFKGSDALDEEEDEITIKDLNLKLDLAIIDSIKTVNVNAYTIDSLGTQIPIDEANINFFVGGMLSKMLIKEETISDGELEFEFENILPGDKDGNITIYAMVQDNDDYGNVTQKQTVNWGAGNIIKDPESNMLWSEAAPIWMYIVLTILLVGVWLNYAYTIYNLFKIKREAKAS